MKINAGLVMALRTKRAWSQEELSIASGLNLRTVQRIETEASASLQSKKALASAFQIDIKDLAYQEIPSMKKHEYKTLDIEIKQGFMSGFTATPLPDIQKILNAEGQNGWRLVQILRPDLLTGLGKSAEKMVAIFERPIES